MSLGSILSTAAPIAAGYFTGGVGGPGFFGLSGAAAGIAAGAATGAGIAALSGGDILGSGVMGGLGGYGGAQMATAFNPAVEGLGKSGLTSAEFNAITQDPNVISGAIDSGVSGGVDISSAFPSTAAPGSYNLAGTSAGASSIANPMAGMSPIGQGIDYTKLSGAGVQLNSAALPNVGTEGVLSNIYTGINPAESISRYTNIAESAIPNPVDRSFSAGVERLGGGDSVMGYGKLGLTSLPLIAAAAYEEPITYDQMKEAEAYDPYETLNLNDPALDSGIEDVINEDSGLRLYANEGGMVPTYAEGGTIESRADQGMRDALARNQGTAYAQPTTTASNVNAQPALNINRGMGSLNVNSGAIGQSPDAVAETARLKAIEDAKPKYTGGLASIQSVQTDPVSGALVGQFGSGNSTIPGNPVINTDPVSGALVGQFGSGNPGFYTTDSGALVGQFGRGYAEGGTVESRADQSMRDALARNQGTAYSQPTTASNVNAQPALNINRDMGSLNVNSGTIGQSANAIAAGAEAARLKAIEDAKPKTPPLTYQQIQTGAPRGAILAGPLQNYDRFIDGSYRKRYAEGGTIESRAKEGMAGALARNKGTAYTRPTTAPVTTTAPSNNIKIAGANNSTSNIGGGSTSNLTGGVGALNVGSGSIGQSPNAIKAAQVAAADRKANFKIMPNGQEVPIDFRPSYSGGVMGGMQTVPQSHYRDSSGNWHKGQRPGTFQIGGNNGSSIGAFLTAPNYYAEGGEVRGYAEGGMLEGPGDGMSDSLAAQIDGSQPAALSQGEFVVPADVVSHLGNGSSDAGSKRLYAMMDEVRQARTGTEKQGKEINPERYMPA